MATFAVTAGLRGGQLEVDGSADWDGGRVTVTASGKPRDADAPVTFAVEGIVPAVTLGRFRPEAAAATVVMMLRGGAPSGEPIRFDADRPFVFAIRHAKTGAILFLGRLADPSK